MSFQKTEQTNEARIMELCTMLTYKRPAWSAGERLFIKRYIVPTGAVADEYGNYWLTIGQAPVVLWSSHTDTVHRTSGSQKVTIGAGVITTDSGECLGADCTTGVWLMLQMIRAKVAGVYVFHRAEEIGGKGSAWIAKNTPDKLAGVQFAIAFDRKGYTDIITHQGGRTASDAFAASLSAALPGMGLKASDQGIFTDTACYTDIIGECSNVSMGYFHGHQAREMQDSGFACKLADALCAADFSGLVASRQAGDSDWNDWGSFKTSYGGKSGSSDRFPMIAGRALEDFVYNNPGVVADFLAECGYDVEDVRIYRDNGAMPVVSADERDEELSDREDERDAIPF